MSEGALGHKFLFIVHGTVHVVRAQQSKGEPLHAKDEGMKINPASMPINGTVAMLPPGRGFGETAVLSVDSKRMATCIAYEEVTCLVVTRDVYVRAVSKSLRLPEFTRWVSQVLWKASAHRDADTMRRQSMIRQQRVSM